VCSTNGYKPDRDAVLKGGHRRIPILISRRDFSRARPGDIPRLKGVPYLEPGNTDLYRNLEAWEQKAGIKVGPAMPFGCAPACGRAARPKSVAARRAEAAGRVVFIPSVIPWLKQRDIAILGAIIRICLALDIREGT